jgi:GNAT superfamily N-acetyltransferase
MASRKSATPQALPVHVTRLEMNAPPRQNLPLPVNLQTAVMRVQNITNPYYRFLYDQVGRRWHWVERLRMKEEELAAILADKRTDVTVLYIDGAPAGFYELFLRDGETVELVHFGLIQHALGKGVGKWFLLQALYAAWASSPLRVTVTTNNLDHPRALQRYQMFGFSPVATEDLTLVPLSDAELLELAKRT